MHTRGEGGRVVVGGADELVQLLGCGRRKGAVERQQLKEDDADRPRVGGCAVGAAENHLRAHVVGGATRHRAVQPERRQTEVTEHDRAAARVAAFVQCRRCAAAAASCEEDVARREVAMQHATRVDVPHGRAQLADQQQHLVRIKTLVARAVSRDLVGQRPAVGVLHEYDEARLGHVRAQVADNVRVAHGPQRCDLIFKLRELIGPQIAKADALGDDQVVPVALRCLAIPVLAAGTRPRA
mmetsp:Transcript_49993/g.131803  ORF Transcript_49993/g.131803 Transcript_49993/m.131803 type:complete len:240 (-) Transcript_49993:89-808(-)